MSVNAERIRIVREFIIQDFLFGRDDGFSSSESFLESGMIDSTGILQLVAFLEHTFGIKVEDAELVPENLDSLDNIDQLLESKMSSGSAQTAGV
jgi:acyl carrier protein